MRFPLVKRKRPIGRTALPSKQRFTTRGSSRLSQDVIGNTETVRRDPIKAGMCDGTASRDAPGYAKVGPQVGPKLASPGTAGLTKARH